MRRLTWTAIHPINSRSPIRGMTPDSLRAREAVIVVSLTGLDETLLQTVPARHIYRAEDVRFGVRFQDVMKPMDEGRGWVVDTSLFDEVIESPLTISTESCALSNAPTLCASSHDDWLGCAATASSRFTGFQPLSARRRRRADKGPSLAAATAPISPCAGGERLPLEM